MIRSDAVLTLRKNGVRSLRIGDAVAVQSPASFHLAPFGYVLLVHGYNNSHKEARDSYARFRWWLGTYGANARVLELHWPGDSIWGAGSLSYWRHVDTARQCGIRLAKWISGAGDARFVLVGHSMGCRLILETLSRLSEPDRRHHIAGVCLMAAAVPVDHVRPGQLGPNLPDSAAWRILYSPGDQVLRLAFRMGQPATFDSLFSRAVGLEGHPESIWNSAPSRSRMQMHDCGHDSPSWKDLYGHGWYWRGGRKTSSFQAQRGIESLPPIEAHKRNRGTSAKVVAGLLGAVINREIPQRCLLSERPLATARLFWSR